MPRFSDWTLKALLMGHICLIALSNILVQYPFKLWGLNSTWGAFTYPVIFILTDLTVRLSSSKDARKIILWAMFPGLVISYVAATLTQNHDDSLLQALSSFPSMPLRIALASFLAYVLGQLLDVYVFQRVRQNSIWWLAPSLSTSLGNLLDTFVFFFVAFYHGSDAFLAAHWSEIALVDMVLKLIISLLAFVPFYGLILNGLKIKHLKQTTV